MSRSVTIIGGGAAGLSAAVFLANQGVNVTLTEASPKLGGRAYSFFDKVFGSKIDNGQHILASWYHNTFEFLKLIGSYDKLTFQKQLEVNFINNEGKSFTLKTAKLPPPLNLMIGVMKYKALEFKDQRCIGFLVHAVEKEEIPESELIAMNTDEFFRLTRQTERTITNFWKPFIIAVFNAEPENTSAYLFSKMIKTGFIEKGGSNLVLPNTFLDELYVQPAVSYLESKNAKVLTNCRAAKINFEDDKATSLILEDNTGIKSDFYISAVPFFDFKNLIGEEIYNRDFTSVSGLKPSPIVNIHLKFDRSIGEVFQKQFAGLLNTKTQWIFKVKNDQICLVISAAAGINEMDKEDIIKLGVNELHNCIPAFKEFNVTGSRVLKETRATFVPDKESLTARPGPKTKFKNFFIAGDWTNTGLPATIEGAVLSAKKISDLLSEAW